MKEVKNFIINLHKEIEELNQKLKFVKSHNFNKEAEFIELKITIARKFLLELELVVSKQSPGSESKFEL